MNKILFSAFSEVIGIFYEFVFFFLNPPIVSKPIWSLYVDFCFFWDQSLIHDISETNR